jgi:hypothetical protein
MHEQFAMTNIKTATPSVSELVRRHAQDAYLRPARHRGADRFEINVGQVHRALALKNRVPLVCQALKSEKFLNANALRLISETGPPSGQSTTVTYTYAFIESEKSSPPPRDPWTDLRGALKNIFAELGGGENYLRNERDAFYPPKESQ